MSVAEQRSVTTLAGTVSSRFSCLSLFCILSIQKGVITTVKHSLFKAFFSVLVFSIGANRKPNPVWYAN